MGLPAGPSLPSLRMLADYYDAWRVVFTWPRAGLLYLLPCPSLHPSRRYANSLEESELRPMIN